MHIYCPNRGCNNAKKFLIPLWVRCTFRFDDDGKIKLLHLKQLESLEEKLAATGKSDFSLTCQECGEPAEIVFNEYEAISDESAQKEALEGL